MTMLNGYAHKDPISSLGLNMTRILTVPEAADILKLSSAMVYKLIQRRELTGVKFGSSIRVRECDLEKYIQESLTNPEF